MNVGRAWRSSPGWLLAGFALLDVLLLIYILIVDAVAGANPPLTVEPVGMLICAGLGFFVWRRSRLAWRLLVLLGAFMLLRVVAFGVVDTYMVLPLLVLAGQMAVLLSPAVRKHVARQDVEGTPPAPDAV
ncbi:hypothetical protein ACWDWO_17190 [Actinopolymorpha singaporensis]